jgi:phosphate transport system substrate-binding protein
MVVSNYNNYGISLTELSIMKLTQISLYSNEILIKSEDNKKTSKKGVRVVMKKKRMLFLSVLLLGVIFSTTAFAKTLVIKGSTTVLPITQKVAEAYMKEFPDVNISISGGGSGNGIKAIIDGTTDIANSSRFIKESEVKQAVDNGAYPVPFSVAYDCIVPVLHPDNPVNELSLDQLQALYTGKIRNWKEVGGDDRPVVVISRDTSSGTYEVWEEKVLRKERVFPGALLQASSGAVVQGVANNKNGIGYIGLGYLTNSVKATTVNGVEGSEETTLSGEFPISRPLFIFTRGWPEGTTVHFINYLLNPEKGQKLVKEAGFVPLFLSR